MLKKLKVINVNNTMWLSLFLKYWFFYILKLFYYFMSFKSLCYYHWILAFFLLDLQFMVPLIRHAHISYLFSASAFVRMEWVVSWFNSHLLTPAAFGLSFLTSNASDFHGKIHEDSYLQVCTRYLASRFLTCLSHSLLLWLDLHN